MLMLPSDTQTRNTLIAVDGTAMPVHVAFPQERPAAAVIVLQERFGINEDVRRITDLLASDGYVGLALNLYHRSKPTLGEPFTEAGLARASAGTVPITPETIRKDVRAAIDWLNDQPGVHVGHIATLGFGLDVGMAAATVRGIVAAIAFEGGRTAPDDPAIEAGYDATHVHEPLLLMYAAKNEEEKPRGVERIEQAMRGAGKRITLQWYPQPDETQGLGTAAFPADTIADAWDLVRAFLQRKLK